ncbi:methylmalonyl-CoA mutase [Sinobacterium caligoides]|uniref:Methylmalonyl-CoA mutase n=1 Tax=Sinobacterium caligoides TaxID=933926 RepID=A0A3N2DDQ2_9GAMM|nr:methylmalonyl-CoA mutase family protein [Sinobacterium caligoides]ROR97921.1 methylmalonyl-CoA mutase [Sinobacterium caligoides]
MTTTSPLRFITATSLFDGHDAAINVVRRMVQERGAEVIHLGHNRSVDEIVQAAQQEDADAIAVSSYQGGHCEFFRYLIDQLRVHDAEHVAVFAGGGGTITAEEIDELQAYGVERIYHPSDGLQLGLAAMVDDVIARAEQRRLLTPKRLSVASFEQPLEIARNLSVIEDGQMTATALARYRSEWAAHEGAKRVPVIGITGPGGAGKSSLTDELLHRCGNLLGAKRVAVLAIDPSRRRTGGALLGDRIRINSLRHGGIYWRSMAARGTGSLAQAVADALRYLRTVGFDLLFVETAGIGQGDSAIVELVDLSLYVMTAEYGAASQLEKIDMLDMADLVVINKSEQRGAEDALREVRRQYRRNHNEFSANDEALPVFATCASRFMDPGVDQLFDALCLRLRQHAVFAAGDWLPATAAQQRASDYRPLIPANRSRYLAEIAALGRERQAHAESQAQWARRLQQYHASLAAVGDELLPVLLSGYTTRQLQRDGEQTLRRLRQHYQQALEQLSEESLALLRQWPQQRQAVCAPRHQYQVRGQTVEGDNYRQSLAAQSVSKVAVPKYRDWGELLNFLYREHLPGHYPYTAGVFPYRRRGEAPTRMFAGEGTPERTNRRFHYIAAGQSAVRLSTAFDSVTLYGQDPAKRPDIFGKVGNAGVSVATVDDMKKLYAGFDLCADNTSVSMTINGPAPILLAFFINAAIDQQVERYLRDQGGWQQAEAVIAALYPNNSQPRYQGELPEASDGLGLALLGVSGEQLLTAEQYQQIKKNTLIKLRGTVQADILKEDQAQNTCIFSCEFALHMMGDMQQYFIDHQIKNFYSVSISGYHIAEAGANPITQLAFTLANGFTLVEYYLARGMAVDDFATNLSFFFSNGMDPEYAVIGRVARRIWARAMRERYGASSQAQRLKYHIQTSGRSLHAQEAQFNDIRTTLQALYALVDNCNSLHTNAFDEALTTPTEASVRRAVAIQLIINQELGLNYCENPWQGSFLIEQLTEQVEEAVYVEFEALSARGGVLAAMDGQYQRGKIQDESMHYERSKHDGTLPLVGVNTFTQQQEEVTAEQELMRSSTAEKQWQIDNLQQFKQRRSDDKKRLLARLKTVAQARGNTFEVLIELAKQASLGEITAALYEVGGEYRRNM